MFASTTGLEAKCGAASAPAVSMHEQSVTGCQVGIALRSLSRGYFPDKGFVMVTFAVTAVFLIGWRTALASITPEVCSTLPLVAIHCTANFSQSNTILIRALYGAVFMSATESCRTSYSLLNVFSGGCESVSSFSGETKAGQERQPFGVFTASHIIDKTLVDHISLMQPVS